MVAALGCAGVHGQIAPSLVDSYETAIGQSDWKAVEEVFESDAYIRISGTAFEKTMAVGEFVAMLRGSAELTSYSRRREIRSVEHGPDGGVVVVSTIFEASQPANFPIEIRSREIITLVERDAEWRISGLEVDFEALRRTDMPASD